MSVRPIDVAVPPPTGAAPPASGALPFAAAAPPLAAGAADSPLRRRWLIAGTLEPWQFFAVVFVFWVYVAASAVLYAYSMGTTLAAFTTEAVFAPWRSRVLQHVLLFPVLLGCYALSLRLDWKPLWWKGPAQLALGVGFALLARPAIMGSEMILKRHWLDTQDGESPTAMSFWLSEKMFTQWIASVTDFLINYGFGLALLTGFVLYKRFRDTQSRVALLERQWTSARLAALRMQLSPHTLFNLLHTIRGNIAWDPPTAQAMVVQLADLLRRLLAAGEREWTRLADEMQFVQLYLELQQRRFSDRLRLELPPPESLPPVWVPSLILQPLVENAVAHGLAGHDGPVTIRVTLEARDATPGGGRIALAVVNDFAPGRAAGLEGIGLRNVRERLAVQLGREARLLAGPETDAAGGATRWRSEILLPALRELPAARREPG